MAVGYTCIRRFISFLTTYGALPDTYNNNNNRPLKRHRVYANVICLPECVYTCVFYSVNVCMEQLCCSVLQCSSVFFETPCILVIVSAIVIAVVASVASITVVVS